MTKDNWPPTSRDMLFILYDQWGKGFAAYDPKYVAELLELNLARIAKVPGLSDDSTFFCLTEQGRHTVEMARGMRTYSKHCLPDWALKEISKGSDQELLVEETRTNVLGPEEFTNTGWNKT